MFYLSLLVGQLILGNMILASLSQPQFGQSTCGAIVQNSLSIQNEPSSSLPLKPQQQEDQESSSANLLAFTKLKTRTSGTVDSWVAHPFVFLVRVLGMCAAFTALIFDFRSAGSLILLAWFLTETVSVFCTIESKTIVSWLIMAVECLAAILAILFQLIKLGASDTSSSITAASITLKIAIFFKLVPLCMGIYYICNFTQGPGIQGCFKVFSPSHIFFLIVLTTLLFTVALIFSPDTLQAYQVLSGDGWFQHLISYLGTHKLSSSHSSVGS